MTSSIDYANSNAGKENISVPNRFSRAYEFSDGLRCEDSVKILRGLSGSIFNSDSNNVIEFVGSFSWNDSLYMHAQR